MDRGYAYTEGGDVYFSVDSYKGYGNLSGRNLEDMRAGSRVAVNDKKRHPMDFVLWKSAKPDEPPMAPAPWGPGRPGWHLECSVMSNKYLGPPLTFMAGGVIFFSPITKMNGPSPCAPMTENSPAIGFTTAL